MLELYAEEGHYNKFNGQLTFNVTVDAYGDHLGLLAPNMRF